MKKVILSLVAVAAIAVGYQKYTQAQTMSDLMLANVEALANNESGNGPCKWKRLTDTHGCVYHKCAEDGDGDSCSPCGSISNS